MQAIKDKMNDMSAMRKAKADAKSEERAERDLAKARVNVAHEVRLAKEAEAEMNLHVAKATEKAEKEKAKHSPESSPAAATAATNNAAGLPTSTTTTTSTTRLM